MAVVHVEDNAVANAATAPVGVLLAVTMRGPRGGDRDGSIAAACTAAQALTQQALGSISCLLPLLTPMTYPLDSEFAQCLGLAYAVVQIAHHQKKKGFRVFEPATLALL